MTLLQDRFSREARSAGYAFTKMLNNAIDHSEATTVHVAVWAGRFETGFEVRDKGRGALPHLQASLGWRTCTTR